MRMAGSYGRYVGRLSTAGPTVHLGLRWVQLVEPLFVCRLAPAAQPQTPRAKPGAKRPWPGRARRNKHGCAIDRLLWPRASGRVLHSGTPARRQLELWERGCMHRDKRPSTTIGCFAEPLGTGGAGAGRGRRAYLSFAHVTYTGDARALPGLGPAWAWFGRTQSLLAGKRRGRAVLPQAIQARARFERRPPGVLPVVAAALRSPSSVKAWTGRQVIRVT